MSEIDRINGLVQAVKDAKAAFDVAHEAYEAADRARTEARTAMLAADQKVRDATEAFFDEKTKATGVQADRTGGRGEPCLNCGSPVWPHPWCMGDG